MTAILTVMVFTLVGCSSDVFSKKLICSNLYSPYCANLEFIFSDGQNNTSGKASIIKNDTVSVSFTEPEAFSGITIKSDPYGNADVFSFEFSGIPASIPKTVTSELSLLFSLFSDEIPSKISSLEKDAFKISEISSESAGEMIEVFFVENNMSYNIIYDKESGIPHSIDAGNDELSVHVELSDFKPSTSE